MKSDRKWLGNDRVKSAIMLCGFMTIAVMVVFFAIEYLKISTHLSYAGSLDPELLKFPMFFKVLVLLAWGSIAVMVAYFACYYQTLGFIKRLSDFCKDVCVKDQGQTFGFRKKETRFFITDSFQNLLGQYRRTIKDLDGELNIIKEDLL